MTDAREIIALANHCAADNASAHDMADAALRALRAAGYRVLGPDEVAALHKALSRAEDGAGALPAKEAVKLCPTDWHALGSLIRNLGVRA